MELISVVTDEEAKLARAMEAKLLKLPIDSGVLFAGVSVQAATPTAPAVFHVWVGCSRSVDPRMIPALVEVTLRKELGDGHKIQTEAAKMGSIRKVS